MNDKTSSDQSGASEVHDTQKYTVAGAASASFQYKAWEASRFKTAKSEYTVR